MNEDSIKYLIIMRQPFLEKVDNLHYFIKYIAEKGNIVSIITTRDKDYIDPSYISEIINITTVTPVQHKYLIYFYVPTMIKIFVESIKIIVLNKPNVVIGADRGGTIIGQLLAQIFNIPFVYYSLEYPVPKEHISRIIERLEHRAIRKADLAITFDDVHARFISHETGLLHGKFMFLPNGSGPRTRYRKSEYLRNKFQFKSDALIILHAGGFGPWFQSIEVGKIAAPWPSSWKLVFHTSQNVENGEYARRFQHENKDTNVILHSKPLKYGDVDDMIGSADIGIAIYNRNLLGYRAELLCQAAGKIGRYLKNGLPVIVQDIPTFQMYIEKYDCGICISKLSQMESAILQIVDKYNYYSNNALKCYDEIWDNDLFSPNIVNRIKGLV
jgi:hypothetical protein